MSDAANRLHSSFPRLMKDAAIHAQNARKSLERAQAKAPESQRPTLDHAIRTAEQLRAYATRSAIAAARRGGIRQARS
jgi:hypothetical protein